MKLAELLPLLDDFGPFTVYHEDGYQMDVDDAIDHEVCKIKPFAFPLYDLDVIEVCSIELDITVR